MKSKLADSARDQLSVNSKDYRVGKWIVDIWRPLNWLACLSWRRCPQSVSVNKTSRHQMELPKKIMPSRKTVQFTFRSISGTGSWAAVSSTSFCYAKYLGQSDAKYSIRVYRTTWRMWKGQDVRLEGWDRAVHLQFSLGIPPVELHWQICIFICY